MDLQNYSTMCAWHLAEMMDLQISDPEVWNKLSKGIWAPNKRNIPFCSLGADEALEQENIKMKVTGGLVEITECTNAHKIFPRCSRVSKLSDEASKLSSSNCLMTQHHECSHAVSDRYHAQVRNIVQCIRNNTNPFQCEEDLLYLVTKAVAPDKVKEDVF